MIWYHFTAVKWYHITSRISFLVTALSHWYPHIICHKSAYFKTIKKTVLSRGSVHGIWATSRNWRPQMDFKLLANQFNSTPSWMDYLSVVRPFTGDITEQQFVVSWDSWSRRSFPGFRQWYGTDFPEQKCRKVNLNWEWESLFSGNCFCSPDWFLRAFIEEYHKGCVPTKTFFRGFKNEARKKVNKDVSCILASFRIYFLQVKKIDLLVHFVRPFIHHQERTMRGLSRHVNALQCFQCIQYTNAISGQVLQTTTSFE